MKADHRYAALSPLRVAMLSMTSSINRHRDRGGGAGDVAVFRGLLMSPSPPPTPLLSFPFINCTQVDIQVRRLLDHMLVNTDDFVLAGKFDGISSLNFRFCVSGWKFAANIQLCPLTPLTPVPPPLQLTPCIRVCLVG